MDPTIIASGISALAGLVKKKGMTPGESIMSTAMGVRKASKATGIHALTLLGASNATAGVGLGADTAPLASLSILADAIGSRYGDEGKVRQEHNILANDLLRLQIEQTRGSAPAPMAADSIGGGHSSLGRPRNAGPSGAPFLDEDDRNPAVADERDTTVSFQSHGEETVVPVGPDLDELLTGVFIDANNKYKKRKAMEATQTIGTPLAIPSSLPWHGSRISEIMPPFQSSSQFWDDFFREQGYEP